MKKTIIFLLSSLMILTATTAFAENAPIATHVETVEISQPVRVWVYPCTVGGMQITGHYEYFHIPMPEQRDIPDGIPTEPAIK